MGDLQKFYFWSRTRMCWMHSCSHGLIPVKFDTMLLGGQGQFELEHCCTYRTGQMWNRRTLTLSTWYAIRCKQRDYQGKWLCFWKCVKRLSGHSQWLWWIHGEESGQSCFSGEWSRELFYLVHDCFSRQCASSSPIKYVLMYYLFSVCVFFTQRPSVFVGRIVLIKLGVDTHRGILWHTYVSAQTNVFSLLMQRMCNLTLVMKEYWWMFAESMATTR